ncbi:hypothetical protein [Vibrio agarivorans]|uniref:hypothetical protein n=1 Tax=Vibrio agarivorans TaxID=153622 RepID=UPI0025B2C94F|nr:hypothetical protein [Vibrio agarivorans]MDN3660200.1 hypothetical protein [Vibrio agarivorans]
MKVHFLGDERVYHAIHSLFKHNNLNIELSFQQQCCCGEEKVAVTMVDSRWFKDFLQTPCSKSSNYVIVIGAYTDSLTKQAFEANHQYRYIAYSELESKLLNVINEVLLTITD